MESLQKLILLSMIFCHIIDDYILQGDLKLLKQKEWWKEYSKLYKNDYITALFTHGFSWTFMMMLTPTIYVLINSPDLFNWTGFLTLFLTNMMVHALVDDTKANLKLMSLTTDQLIHLGQIVITWFVYYLFWFN
jgi:hypothetical protein